MQHPGEGQAEAWIKRANDDERSIRAILEGERGAPSTACFLSQQMAEKYLKAFLVAHQQEFPKIHQLDRLVELCSQTDPACEQLRENTIALSDYYVDARYPGDSPEFTFDECRQAFDSALRIKEFVLERIKK